MAPEPQSPKRAATSLRMPLSSCCGLSSLVVGWLYSSKSGTGPLASPGGTSV